MMMMMMMIMKLNKSANSVSHSIPFIHSFHLFSQSVSVYATGIPFLMLIDCFVFFK